MLQITADIFSGRPNPSWVIEDARHAREAFAELTEAMKSAKGPSEDVRLGLRGFEISVLGDGFSRFFAGAEGGYISVQSLASSPVRQDVVNRLMGVVERASLNPSPFEHVPLSGAPLRALVLEQIEETVLGTVRDLPQPPSAPQFPVPNASCTIDTLPYNKAFWNTDPHIQRSNNCYNYASNRRTDTFAQPGRGGGQVWTRITCHEISQALIRDGLRLRYHCFPDTEKPRQLIALVIWPPENDFHFYRRMTERFWGHKPGSTPVINYDSNLEFIYDPVTCNRGPYTEFCSFWYTCRSQRIA